MAFQLGDNCKSCGFPVLEDNAAYSGVILRTWCKTCHKERQDEYNHARLNTPEVTRSNNLRKRHGITAAEYDRKLSLQLGGCAICKQPCKTSRNLAVDHNHTTGVHRDLLCQRCNVVLGLVNDDELLLFDMMDYLKRHETKVAS
jgi:Recombination endonuclease VII